MIANRLRAIARACAAVANGEHIDTVDVIEFVPEPLRDAAAGWLDCGMVTGIRVAERLAQAEWVTLGVIHTLRRLAKGLRDA